MFGTVYCINNELYASKDVFFGWCFWSDGYDPEPLDGMDEVKLGVLQQLFVGPQYPDDMRESIDAALQKLKHKEDALRQEREARISVAEANAVSADDIAIADMKKELDQLRFDHRCTMSYMAISYLQQQYFLTSDVQRVIAILRDFSFDLEPRKIRAGDKFLTDADCRVAVKKPVDPELAELLDGVLPFVDQAQWVFEASRITKQKKMLKYDEDERTKRHAAVN